MRRRAFLTTAGAAVLLPLVASCNGDRNDEGSETNPERRPLTQQEATALSGALAGNYEAGGIRFEAHRQIAAGTLTVVGEISYDSGLGRAGVSGPGYEGFDQVAWDRSQVAERRLDLAQHAPAGAADGIEWVGRPLQPQQVILDNVLVSLFALANENRDNPLLVQQNEGAAYVRATELRGEPVDVLAYNAYNNYWLNASGELLRYESTRPEAQYVVDVIDRAAFEVSAPENVVPLAEVAAWYPLLLGVVGP